MLKRLIPLPVCPAVKAEQIRLLYQQGATTQILGILTAIIGITVFWQVADHAMLALWLGAHVVVSVIRLTLNRKFTTSAIVEQDAIEKWGTTYVIGTFISGLIWASLSLFFDPSWASPYQVMLFVIYTGIIAGSYNTNASLFVAFPAFYLPPATSLAYIMFNQSGSGFLQLGTLFIIYIVLMYVSALKLHNRLAQTLEIRFENERLAQTLAHSNQQLTLFADTDELTRIHNRRAMNRCLASEWNRHHRVQEPLSLLFIDLDFFKQYNDTYGHAGGDQCLIRIAQILQNHAKRSIDMAARFGGEEFAIILPETDEVNALKIAEEIRADTECLQIPHSSSSVADHVTLSIGVATLIPAQPDNERLLCLSADEALYQAKRRGRNRVIHAHRLFDSTMKMRMLFDEQ
jgi:diguanylate cyclase (GGDEF)-like protein